MTLRAWINIFGSMTSKRTRISSRTSDTACDASKTHYSITPGSIRARELVG